MSRSNNIGSSTEKLMRLSDGDHASVLLHSVLVKTLSPTATLHKFKFCNGSNPDGFTYASCVYLSYASQPQISRKLLLQLDLKKIKGYLFKILNLPNHLLLFQIAFERSSTKVR